MPLQSMRTKSAGLLGASTKLPPLERNGSGEGAGLRGGEGGMGGGREPGDFRRGSGVPRNITSAPTMVGPYYPSSVAAQSPAAPARMDAAKAGEPADGRTPTSSGMPGGQYYCLSPVDLAADRAAGLSVSRGSVERSLDWKGMARFSGNRSPRDVGESGAGKRAMRSRASLAPISVPAAATTSTTTTATATAAAEAEGAEALTSLVITSLGGGGLGSSAVFGFGGFSNSSGGGDVQDKSGFLACSTPGGTNSSNSNSNSNVLFNRPPLGGPFLASSCSSSGNGIAHHHGHGVTEAGAGSRRGEGCGDGKVSVV